MATIYEKTAGALIATPGRTVATFPSGLCRVDQKYVCTTANAATHRATLAVGNDMPDGNDAPAIDGLKIYPAPQEIERGDGFTEFSVSAYGRTSSTMINLELVKQDIDVSSTWTRMETTYKKNIVTVPYFSGSGIKTYQYFDGSINTEVNEVRSVNLPNSSVSFWEFKGKVAIPRGTQVQFDDLNIETSLLLPFDAIYYGEDKTVLSVTAGESFKTNGVTGRYYSIIFTTDGVNPSGTWKIYITDPDFFIANQQSYGDFVEADVISRRSNSQEYSAI